MTLLRRACLEFRGSAPRKGHQHLADEERQDSQQPGDPEQGQQDVPGRQSGSAQDGDFRVSRQRQQRVERADQRGDRNQFIERTGQAERDVGDGMRELVAASADAAQLVDQVEEAEQGEEGEKNQEDCGKGLTHQVALIETQGKHQAAFLSHGMRRIVRR